MKYTIHITSTAELDLEKAYDYIDLVLKNRQAANALLDEATKQINALATMPKKFSLIDDPVLKAYGIRFTMINNYHAFYIVSPENKHIIIIRILYAKRNWQNILKQELSIP